jgi:hypothetical protein
MAPDPCLLTLEVVSPLFIGGADCRATDPAEEGIRVPSLRGALRYWYRALLAAGEDDALRGAETEVFGAAERPSPLVVRTWPLARPTVGSWEDVRRARRGGGPGRPAPSGREYLGAVALRAMQQADSRRAILPGARYAMELSWRGPREPAADLQRRLAATLWLMGRFGSLGSRARRGFGAVQVVGIERGGFLHEAMAAVSPVVAAGSAVDLARDVEGTLRYLRSLRLGGRPSTGYPNLGAARVFVREGQKDHASWEDVLDDVGSRYREFRMSLRPVQRRLPFGAPILVRGGQQVTLDGLKRRASPLRFRPVKLATGRYALAGIWFEDELSPSGRGDHAVIREFVTTALRAKVIPA